jgi:putative addiction module killer protein
VILVTKLYVRLVKIRYAPKPNAPAHQLSVESEHCDSLPDWVRGQIHGKAFHGADIIDIFLKMSNISYMDYSVETLPEFDDWLDSITDDVAQAAIANRVERMRRGLFGDWSPVGDGVSELRIDVGQGFRSYYVIRKLTTVIVLCGGTKKTQVRDIKRAKKLAADV